MANPTTNYNFAMPQNSDLVKDLPADFEIFGQAVDTQMKTNADAAIAKSLLTTTGDTIYASAASTPARLGIGSTGQILTVAGGVPTWATPSGGGGLTLLSTTSLSGTSVTVSSISQSYKNLQILVRGATLDGSTKLLIQANESSSLSRCGYWDNASGSNQTASNGALSVDNQSSGQVHTARVLIYNYTDTSYGKLGNSVFNYGSNNPSAFSIGGYAYSSTSAVSSIKITNTGGASFTAGQVLIYGVN